MLATSALLHVAALALLLAQLAPRRVDEPARQAMSVVWASAVRPLAAPPVEDLAMARPKARSGARRMTPRAALAAPAAPVPAAADSVAPVVVSEVRASAPAPVFDRQAALAAARQMASQGEPARAGTVGAELDARRVVLETDTEKLGRVIASAKRSDCIKAQGGGSLLTPLMWLLDKKGSGCKL